MMAAVPNLLDQLRAHFDWLDQSLADSRSFLQGSAASLADLAAYHPIWFLKQNFGLTAAPLDGFPRLLSWAERVAAIGHGRRSPMTSEQALDVARTATSIAKTSTDAKNPIGRKPGQVVSVTPDDTGRDPVVGELVASSVRRSSSGAAIPWSASMHTFSARRIRGCVSLTANAGAHKTLASVRSGPGHFQ